MNGVFDEFQILGERNAQCIRHLERPTFAEERDGRGTGLQKRLQIFVFPDRIAGFPRRAERDNRRIPKRHGFDLSEELNVLGIRSGPSALDEMHTKFIELMRDAKLILDGEADVLRLGPIPQRRIVDLQCGGLRGGERRHAGGVRSRRPT